MSHTNNYAKNDPYVAEIASKVDAILEQYDDVLGNLQVPFNVGQAMVKAHERGDRSKFESTLEQYQLYLSEDSPLNVIWQKNIFTNAEKEEIKDVGAGMGNWFKFLKHVKMFLKLANDTLKSGNPRFQVVFYSMFD